MFFWCTTCSLPEHQSLFLCLLHEIDHIFLSHSVFWEGICASASSPKYWEPLVTRGEHCAPFVFALGQGSLLLWQLKQDGVRGLASSASLNAALWVWFCGFVSNLWTLYHLSVDSPCGLVQAAKGSIHTVFSQVKLRWLVPSNIFCMFPVYILNLWGRSGQKVGNLLLLMYSEK